MNDQQPSGEDLDPVPQESNPAAEPTVAERKPSKLAVFIAMAAVARAILIVMLAPGSDTAPPVTASKGNLTGSPNSAEEDAAADAKAAGKAAPTRFTPTERHGPR